MTFARSKKLNQYFHLNDENNKLTSSDSLYKIRPILDISNKFDVFYQPGQNLAVDKVIIRYKRRLHFKQYMPLKPTK